MKRTITIVLISLTLLLGLGLILYPTISNHYTERHLSQVHTEFQEVVELTDQRELDAARAAAERFNRQMAEGFAQDAEDSLKDGEGAYDHLLDLAGNGIMAYVEIPGIDVMLPIYHGISEEVLQKGAGHMPNTSLPIGGKEAHAVLAAHSGMASARMFTDLERLEKGDLFYIHVLGMTLTYEVDQILMVTPTQVDALRIDPEQDYVTLLTCTPYGVNTHRLLVRGHRVELLQENG